MSGEATRMTRRGIAGLLVFGTASGSWPLIEAASGADTMTERVKRIISEHLKVEIAKITLESEFVRDLGADSLDCVELVMAYEEEFGKHIPDEVAAGLVTVGDAIAFIESGKIPKSVRRAPSTRR
jgi:acyl carrier protein